MNFDKQNHIWAKQVANLLLYIIPITNACWHTWLLWTMPQQTITSEHKQDDKSHDRFTDGDNITWLIILFCTGEMWNLLVQEMYSVVPNFLYFYRKCIGNLALYYTFPGQGNFTFILVLIGPLVIICCGIAKSNHVC